MQEKLESLKGYVKNNDNKDIINIIKVIKGRNFKHNEQNYHYLGLSKAMRRLYTIHQVWDVTLY